MRIGIYLGYPFHVLLDGEGIGRYVFRLAEGLLAERAGTGIDVLVMPPNVAVAEGLFAELKGRYPGRVTVHCSDCPDWINANVPAAVWIVPWVGLESAKYLRKPIIVCLHDLAYIHFPELADLGKRIDGTARLLTGKAAAIICSSSYIRSCDGLDYLGLAERKTYVVRPAAPTAEYSQATLRDEREFREGYGLDKRYFVFPTIVRPHKNHVRLITAFLRFRAAQADRRTGPYLVFTDYLENFAGLKDQLAPLIGHYPPEVPAGIRCIGRLPVRDLPALYRYAAGTVVPTLFEGSCPFPILESLIMGAPVAFGRIEVTLEVIEDVSAFITFDPYDTADIERAIGELWAGGASAGEKQKAAASGFLGRSWRDAAREYYEVIGRVLRRGG